MMRPLRLVLLLICFVVCPVIFTFFTLLSTHPPHQLSSTSAKSHSNTGFSALFSFHTPSSLFPPSAIISLTDENSTFFLARPAAFGPLLPARGLSGRLWLGSGFGDDNLRRGGTAMGAEGELGCSDVPGWGDGGKDKTEDRHARSVPSKRSSRSYTGDEDVEASHDTWRIKRSTTVKGADVSGTTSKSDMTPSEEDGTDDYLHHPLPGSEALRSPKSEARMHHEPFRRKSKVTAHADIQSLQESAEITGKIALLGRGGCGFLEKVKWVQRRGGVALIVGDDTRGGGLVTMYARGDTSNVTIPALFTSHTTAHLLSSLIPPGGFADDLFSTEPAKFRQDDSRSSRAGNKKKGGKFFKASHDGPTFTPTASKPTNIPTPRPTIVPVAAEVVSSADGSPRSRSGEHLSWLHSFLSILGFGGRDSLSRLPEDSRRPPSSGHLDWVLLDDEKNNDATSSVGTSNADNKDRGAVNGAEPRTSQRVTSNQTPGDDFIIGVQDWRDPDVLGIKSALSSSRSSASRVKETPFASGHKPVSSATMKSPDKVNDRSKNSPHNGDDTWEGGSITPGSGEYGKPEVQDSEHGKPSKPGSSDSVTQKGNIQSEVDRGWWFKHLPWAGEDDEFTDVVQTEHQVKQTSSLPNRGAHVVEDLYGDDGDFENDEEHEGLWITLTPTSVSASPFFDTLLVLVISPLVTLTIVYALLLLRSRIRRRRWRAPKSVVDRLPVRTYHTMTCSSSSTSSQPASPTGSLPTTPLLPTSPRSSSPRPRPRPRSRAASDVGAAVAATLGKATTKAPVLQHEKVEGSRQWKKRYNGKQVECVVCLEEYVDGQSRVMSLPCGHEFHVECITPWLTTRRRTCPICKGDVVRSMNSASATTVAEPAYRDDPDEGGQPGAVGPVDPPPSSAIPVPYSPLDGDTDLERGDDLAATLVNDGASSTPRSGWRGLASSSLSAFSGEAAWRQAQAERER